VLPKLLKEKENGTAVLETRHLSGMTNPPVSIGPKQKQWGICASLVLFTAFDYFRLGKHQ